MYCYNILSWLIRRSSYMFVGNVSSKVLLWFHPYCNDIQYAKKKLVQHEIYMYWKLLIKSEVFIQFKIFETTNSIIWLLQYNYFIMYVLKVNFLFLNEAIQISRFSQHSSGVLNKSRTKQENGGWIYSSKHVLNNYLTYY